MGPNGESVAMDSILYATVYRKVRTRVLSLKIQGCGVYSMNKTGSQQKLSVTGVKAAAQHLLSNSSPCTVKNAVELFFAFHPDVEKIQYH